MDTVLLSSTLASVAVFAGLLALVPGPVRDGPDLRDRVRRAIARRRSAAAAELAQARLDLSPGLFLALQVGAPVILGLLGLLLSPPLGLIGAITGAVVPRVYLRSLVGSEARAAADDAPRVLRAMVNRAAAGGTYPELFAAATEAARHRWVKADFEELLGRYYAQESAAEALAELRARQASRNLRLVFDALVVLVRTHQSATAAGEVLATLGDAARANQAIAKQAAAESRGLRLQAAILAVVIPGMFIYLSVANPELTAPVTSTALGQLVLLPLGIGLEISGIVLSWRVTRLEA